MESYAIFDMPYPTSFFAYYTAINSAERRRATNVLRLAFRPVADSILIPQLTNREPDPEFLPAVRQEVVAMSKFIVIFHFIFNPLLILITMR